MDFTVPLSALSENQEPWKCSICSECFDRKSKAKKHVQQCVKAAKIRQLNDLKENRRNKTEKKKRIIGEVLHVGPKIKPYPEGARLFCPSKNCKRSMLGNTDFSESPLNARPFKSVFEVRRHWYRTHTTSKPYVCDTCTGEKKFASALKTDLNEHKRVCGREKLIWTCANVDCKTKCGTKKALVRHCSSFGHELPVPLVGKPAGAFPLYDPIKTPMSWKPKDGQEHAFIGSKVCEPKRPKKPETSGEHVKSQSKPVQKSPVVSDTRSPSAARLNILKPQMMTSGSKLLQYEGIKSPADMNTSFNMDGLSNNSGRKVVYGGAKLFGGIPQVQQVPRATKPLAQPANDDIIMKILQMNGRTMPPAHSAHSAISPQSNPRKRPRTSNNHSSFMASAARRNVLGGSKLFAHETKLVESASGSEDEEEENNKNELVAYQEHQERKRSKTATKKNPATKKSQRRKQQSSPNTGQGHVNVVGGSRLLRHEREVVSVTSGETSVDSIILERQRRRREKHRQIKLMSMDQEYNQGTGTLALGLGTSAYPAVDINKAKNLLSQFVQIDDLAIPQEMTM